MSTINVSITLSKEALQRAITSNEDGTFTLDLTTPESADTNAQVGKAIVEALDAYKRSGGR